MAERSGVAGDRVDQLRERIRRNAPRKCLVAEDQRITQAVCAEHQGNGQDQTKCDVGGGPVFDSAASHGEILTQWWRGNACRLTIDWQYFRLISPLE